MGALEDVSAMLDGLESVGQSSVSLDKLEQKIKQGGFTRREAVLLLNQVTLIEQSGESRLQGLKLQLQRHAKLLLSHNLSNSVEFVKQAPEPEQAPEARQAPVAEKAHPLQALAPRFNCPEQLCTSQKDFDVQSFSELAKTLPAGGYLCSEGQAFILGSGEAVGDFNSVILSPRWRQIAFKCTLDGTAVDVLICSFASSCQSIVECLVTLGAVPKLSCVKKLPNQPK